MIADAVDQGEERVAVEGRGHGADHPVAAPGDGLGCRVLGVRRFRQGAPQAGFDQRRFAGAGGAADDEEAPGCGGAQPFQQIQGLGLAAEQQPGEFGVPAPVIGHETGIGRAGQGDAGRRVAAEEAGEYGAALGGVAVAIFPAGADFADQGADRGFGGGLGQGAVVLCAQPVYQLAGDGERLAAELKISEGRMAVQDQFQKGPSVAFLLPQRQAGEQVAQGLGDRQVALGVGGHPRRLLAGSGDGFPAAGPLSSRCPV